MGFLWLKLVCLFIHIHAVDPMNPVLADKYTQPVSSSSFISVRITDCTKLSLLLSELSEALPLPYQLSHLKRIRSTKVDNKKQFHLLLAYKTRLPKSVPLSKAVEHLIPLLSSEMRHCFGEISTVQVPNQIPLTSVQYEEAKVIWPTVFSHNVKIEKQISPDRFSLKELARMHDYMSAALELANQSKHSGAPPVAAVVVDPKCKKIIAGHHHSAGSCLDHAVMLCIREVAKIQKETLLVPPGIKRKAGDIADAHNPFNPMKYHLCTGLEVYTTQEPCAMCCMALVHARISTVVYGMANAEMGGLGSVYKIHCKEGVNHHFDVYKGLLEHECIQLWNQ